jgi:hypothetical protein
MDGERVGHNQELAAGGTAARANSRTPFQSALIVIRAPHFFAIFAMTPPRADLRVRA